MKETLYEVCEYLNGIVSAPLYAILISWGVAFTAGFFVGY